MLSSEINLYSLKPVSYFQKVIFCSLVICIFFNKTLTYEINQYGTSSSDYFPFTCFL